MRDEFTIDFLQIKKSDQMRKRETKFWSGQDVLGDQMDSKKSILIVESLSSVRIWPRGIKGLLKRLRAKSRVVVKSVTFDSCMNLFVLLNTITLSLNSHGMSVQLLETLETFNVWFTWIFISEMLLKIASIGINKYSSDKMNMLDGSIAFFSLFEIIIEMVTSNISSGDLTTFRLIRVTRMIRSFRVLRISRLLRTMQSI